MSSSQSRHERNKENAERGIVRRADCWLQAERIAHYLPVLYRQRKEVAQKLEQLDVLIADEEQAEGELRLEAEPHLRETGGAQRALRREAQEVAT